MSAAATRELCELVTPPLASSRDRPDAPRRLGSIEAIATAKGERWTLPPNGHFVHERSRFPSPGARRARERPPSRCSDHDPAGAVASGATAVVARARPPIPKTRPTCSPRSDVRLADGHTAFQLQLDGPNSPGRGPAVARTSQRSTCSPPPGRTRARHRPFAHRHGALAGAGPRTPATADPQPSCGSGRDRRRLQLHPDGAASALESLREHPATRACWSPGMVELRVGPS